MTGTDAPDRLASFDGLRAIMTVLVVFHHAALTYGAIGGWFYRERPPGGDWQSVVLIIFCTVNQAYFMGLFFLLAGYFAPASLARKGRARFILDRTIRLGIPLLVFGLILAPLAIVIAQSVHGYDAASVLQALWNRRQFEVGPLWFAQALLIFSIAAAAFPHGSFHGPHGTQSRNVPPAPRLLALAIATGALAFALRLRWPIGQELYGMQLGYFASYVVLFALGWAASSSRSLERIPPDTARTLRRVAWLTMPTLLPLAVLGATFPVFAQPSAGGWTIPSTMYAFWEPLVAAGIITAWLQFAHARLASPPLWLATLSRRAYCIFVIHPPVLVALAVGMRTVTIAPLLKFLLLGALGTYACYALAGLILRSGVARRVL